MANAIQIIHWRKIQQAWGTCAEQGTSPLTLRRGWDRALPCRRMSSFCWKELGTACTHPQRKKPKWAYTFCFMHVDVYRTYLCFLVPNRVQFNPFCRTYKCMNLYSDLYYYFKSLVSQIALPVAINVLHSHGMSVQTPVHYTANSCLIISYFIIDF